MNPYKTNVYRNLIRPLLWLAVWVGSSFACTALADAPPDNTDLRFDHWERASDDELDQLRGGFVFPNGVIIDFSLERITSLNGSVVSSSFFQLPENAALFRNGSLNQSPDLAGSGLSSVIQNNLDNQIIRTVTAINIAVSNLKNSDLTHSGMVFNNLIQPNIH
ncbi:MAG: hypothetical protein Q8R54_01555 [Methylobacter sp.]|nr:hypothetical protein [Methylobacter sp.]